MKKLLIIPVALMALVACKKEAASSSENQMQIVNIETDSTMYGISEKVFKDSLQWIQSLSDQSMQGNADTAWISLLGTQKLGSLQPGHRIAILFSQGNRAKAKIAIDMTELMGRWVEPDAVDEGMVQGFELQEGGAATSINSRANHYVSWSIYNGKLLMVNSLNGVIDHDIPKDTFQITYLSHDSLRVNSAMSKHYFRRSNGDQDDKVQEYDNYSSPDAGAFDPEGEAPEGSETPEIPEYDRVF